MSYLKLPYTLSFEPPEELFSEDEYFTPLEEDPPSGYMYPEGVEPGSQVEGLVEEARG